MNVSRLVVCGLLMTLLSLRIEAKPISPAQQKSLRDLLGDGLTDSLAFGEREQALDMMRSRLLRDLRLSPRAKAMWPRPQSDQPAARRQKPGSKKAGQPTRNGCFGHKMDRISTISGMGC